MCGSSLDNLIEKLPQVDFCCCGCKLSTGAKIIAWINFIYGIVVQIALVATTVALVVQVSVDTQIPQDNKAATIAGVVIGACLIILLWIGLGIIPGLYLLLGIYKNEVGKVRCYLHFALVVFIVAVSFAGLGLLLMLFVNPAVAIARLVQFSISQGITFYLIVVVKSFYTEQKAAFEQLSAGPME